MISCKLLFIKGFDIALPIWFDYSLLQTVSSLYDGWSAGGWRRLQLIPNARVPILKFESSHQGISCDMSIDNIQGQTKSKILFWISAVDGRFHDMVLLVHSCGKTILDYVRISDSIWCVLSSLCRSRNGRKHMT